MSRIRAGLCLLLALPGVPCAQDPAKKRDKEEAWRVDPHGCQDPETQKRLGYVSLGPFPFGDDHGTAEIEQTLGGVKLLWTETAHFRFGSGLPAYTLGLDKDEKQKLGDEVKRLKLKLGKLKFDGKQLDPWLRHHLFAQRIEDCYEDFCKRLGVDEAATPRLGQKGKFAVLLLEKASAFGRYQVRYLKVTNDGPQRHNFIDSGVMFYGSATEHGQGAMRNDTALHCQTVFNLIHNFVAAYKGYYYTTPLWWEEGLAHWFERRIDPKRNSFSYLADVEGAATKEWDWKPKIRARVGFDHFVPFARMLEWQKYEELNFADHMMVWSRVDYVMSLGDDKFAAIMNELKGRQDSRGIPPTPEQLVTIQLAALQKVLSCDPKGFDQAWKQWVLAKYK